MATGTSSQTSRARPTRSAASGAWRVEEGALRESTGISGPESCGGAPRLLSATRPSADYQRLCKEEAAMKNRVGMTVVITAMAAMLLGCSQQSGTAVVIEDKVYTVTPASVTVKAGIVTGEVTEMKITERVEKGSGR